MWSSCTIMLWDLAGSEEFNTMRTSYLRGASGVLLVGDLTRPDTFASLPAYLDEVRRLSPTAAVVLAANKVDRLNGGGQDADLDPVRALAATLGAPLYLTSALLDAEVEAVFRHLARLLVQDDE